MIDNGQHYFNKLYGRLDVTPEEKLKICANCNCCGIHQINKPKKYVHWHKIYDGQPTSSARSASARSESARSASARSASARSASARSASARSASKKYAIPNGKKCNCSCRHIARKICENAP